MRWEPGQRSDNLEDRRGEGTGGGLGGGGGRLPGGGLRLGLGGIVLLLALSAVTGTNFFELLDPGSGLESGQPGPGGIDSGASRGSDRPAGSPAEERQVEFVSFVLDDTQQTWTREFRELGRPYQDAKLVLFTDATRTACGFGEAAMGPFYCPADQKVYIDLGFYKELRDRFGAGGDFAQAYVIAHELGHHVQNQLGISDRVRRAQQQNPRAANELSVRLELQADCLAGVWGHSTARRDILESGDVEEGMGAAAAVGDDRLQRQATGRVSPESWTHGSSKQRVGWFRRGLESGQIADCDTFAQKLPIE